MHDSDAIDADLHSHSCHSDGTMTPKALVERAAERGVELFALTDHDDTSGLAEAAIAAASCELRILMGVEVSVTWGSTTVHIVGLGIDPADAVLQKGLDSVRSGRLARARIMGDELATLGIEGVFEGALVYAGNPAMISRTHFARHLVETGVCRTVREVFTRFLVEGKPGYVPHQWAKLDDAVRWIRGAGGVAVLAHPARYRVGELGMHALLTDFREAGGQAIEVATSNHTADDMRRYARLAEEFGFDASRGSDFHGPGEAENVELGQVARLPAGLTPVWRRFVA